MENENNELQQQGREVDLFTGNPAESASVPLEETAPAEVKNLFEQPSAVDVVISPAEPQSVPDSKPLFEPVEKPLFEQPSAEVASVLPQAVETPLPQQPAPVQPQAAAPAEYKPAFARKPLTGGIPSREPFTEKPVAPRPVLQLKIDLESASIGLIMRNARTESGLSIDDVKNSTRLKQDYIEAIEKDDFDSLPPGIFPIAYIRTLCRTYHLSKENCDEIFKKVRSLAPHTELPEQILQKLEKDVQKNYEEEQRIKKIFYSAAAVAVLLLVGITAGIFMLFTSAGGKPSKQTAPVISSTHMLLDEEVLERLSPPQAPAMRELKIPTGK